MQNLSSLRKYSADFRFRLTHDEFIFSRLILSNLQHVESAGIESLSSINIEPFDVFSIVHSGHFKVFKKHWLEIAFELKRRNILENLILHCCP